MRDGRHPVGVAAVVDEVRVSPRTPGPSGRPSPGAGAPGSLGPGRGRSGARWAQPSTGTGESGCCCGTSCASELPCPAAPFVVGTIAVVYLATPEAGLTNGGGGARSVRLPAPARCGPTMVPPWTFAPSPAA